MKLGAVLEYLNDAVRDAPHVADHDTNVDRVVLSGRKKTVLFRINEVSETETLLAGDVLTMAATGGMPDTYWHSDQRIERARKVLGFTVEQARAWAQERTR